MNSWKHQKIELGNGVMETAFAKLSNDSCLLDEKTILNDENTIALGYVVVSVSYIKILSIHT